MTRDSSLRLHLVTDNSVEHLPDDVRTAADRAGGSVPGSAVMADLLRRAEALDARVAAEVSPRPLRPLGLLLGIAGLTVVLALLGQQAWQLPGRDAGGVTGVPQSLLTFLLLCAAVCGWTAGRLVRPADALRSTAATQLWWVLVWGSALVSLATALSLASFAGTGQRPDDLLLRCAVPLVPALLAGFLARDAGRTARFRAALGTGLVTVPMSAVGWALLSSAPRSTADLGDALGMTVLAAVAPLALAVAFVAADRRDRRTR